MEMLLTVLTPLIVAIIGFAVFTLMRRENERKSDKLNRYDFVIRSSIAWGIVMLVIDAFLIALLVVGNIEKSMGIANIIIAIFILVFGYGALAILRESIYVNGEEIIHTPPIGKKKVYLFSDIERVDMGKGCYKIYVRTKHVFSIEQNAIGARLFCDLIREKTKIDTEE